MCIRDRSWGAKESDRATASGGRSAQACEKAESGGVEEGDVLQVHERVHRRAGDKGPDEIGHLPAPLRVDVTGKEDDLYVRGRRLAQRGVERLHDVPRVPKMAAA